jgi:hypothetical protein
MAEVEILPVPTRILTDADDIVDAIEYYAGARVTADDLVCCAESVVAVTQGRIARPEELNISGAARFACSFIPDYGSLASPHGMQALMDVEGKWRVLFALFAGFLGKLVGKNGLFYQWGGKEAALIDDVTGTMPPFDKVIVYGPAEPDQVAARIRDRVGAFGGMIADVNDLKRSRVVGVSDGVNGELAAQLLLDNPFGNASQKTPICIIKNYRQYQESHRV